MSDARDVAVHAGDDAVAAGVVEDVERFAMTVNFMLLYEKWTFKRWLGRYT